MISFPIQSSEVKADPCKVQNPTKEKRTKKFCSEFESTRQIYKFTISKRKAKRPFPQRQSPANCILPKEGSITVPICDYNESRKICFTEEDTNTFHQSLPKNAMM